MESVAFCVPAVNSTCLCDVINRKAASVPPEWVNWDGTLIQYWTCGSLKWFKCQTVTLKSQKEEKG